jgi:hypothetical protein
MYTTDDQQKADIVLSELAGTIQNFSDSMYEYLCHIKEQEVLNPLQEANFTSIEGIKRNEFLETFGIRRMVLNALPGKLTIPDYNDTGNNKKNIIPCHWNSIKNGVIIEELEALFKICAIIQFANWASVFNASEFWDGLLSDVIRPLNKKDFQFIFYLGDPTKRYVFETDEILDIISDYSFYGKVTLVLNENEADKLWGILHGWYPGATHFGFKSSRATEKYLSIFNTMNIDALVIFSANSTVLFSKEQRFEFAGKTLNNVNTSGARDYFDTGYQLGSLLQLKIPHRVALGLAILGTYLQNISVPNQTMLLNYIKEWITELKVQPGKLKNEFREYHLESNKKLQERQDIIQSA